MNETQRIMQQIRDMAKYASDNGLLEAWEENKNNLSNEGIAINAILETELERRGLIDVKEEE